MSGRCPHCDTWVDCTVQEPGVSASTLGPGTFHEACAKAVWTLSAEQLAVHKGEVHKARSDAAKRRATEGPSVRKIRTHSMYGQTSAVEGSELAVASDDAEAEHSIAPTFAPLDAVLSFEELMNKVKERELLP